MTSLPRELAQQALRHLTRTLPAERVMVLVESGGRLVAAASNGTGPDHLSLSLLATVMREGAPVLLCEAREDPVPRNRPIRSVLCVPFREPSGRVAGLLYADSRRKGGVFGYQHLERTALFAREMERKLRGGSEPISPGPELPGTGRQPPGRSRPRALLPSRRALVIFFRSLAALLSAGVFVDRALVLLARQSEEPAMGVVSGILAARVGAGQRLSRAMAGLPAVFTSLQIGLVTVGEECGRIDHVVSRLAQYEEASHALARRLQSSLTYPAVVFLVSLGGLLLAPPFLLEGHFQLIRESGQEPPLLTALVMGLSDLARSPLGQMAVLLLGVAAAVAGRRLRERPEIRLWIASRFLALPVLGRLVRAEGTLRFARALALQLDAGRSLLGALEVAAEASGQPVLVRSIGRSTQSLRQGHDLVFSLSAAGFFPRQFLEMLRAGVESGEISQMAHRTADMYEVELAATLETLISLLEPLVLMVLGLVVALLVLATILPIVGLFASV